MQFHGFVGLDDDFLVQPLDAPQLGVPRRRVAVGRKRHVALAELRDGVGRLAGGESPATVPDRLLGDGLQIDQRAVVGRPLRRGLFPQLPVLRVRLASLLLQCAIGPLEVLALLLWERRADLPRLRLLIEAARDDHARVLLEAVLAGRVGLVPRGDGHVELRGGDLVALADDELEQALSDGELLGRREVARLLAAIERGVLGVQEGSGVGVDAALAQEEGVAGRLDLVLKARLAVRVLPRLEFDGLSAAQRVRAALHAEGGRDEGVLRTPL